MSETVHFSKDIYPRGAVSQAIDAYSELGTFEMTEDDGSLVVTITNLDPEVSNLVDEFCNYALHETVAQRGEGLAS